VRGEDRSVTRDHGPGAGFVGRRCRGRRGRHPQDEDRS